MSAESKSPQTLSLNAMSIPTTQIEHFRSRVISGRPLGYFIVDFSLLIAVLLIARAQTAICTLPLLSANLPLIARYLNIVVDCGRCVE